MVKHLKFQQPEEPPSEITYEHEIPRVSRLRV